MSGVRQPSVSQFLSGRVDMSDTMLDRLLACMGYRLEVVRRPVEVAWTRSSERSWRLHREIATELSHKVLAEWRPTIERNLSRLRAGVRGEPNRSNVERWQRLLAESDLRELRRVLTGVDRVSIEMREVSPMAGVLAEERRLAVLASR